MEEQQESTCSRYNSFKGKSIKEILELQSKLGTKKIAKIITSSSRKGKKSNTTFPSLKISENTEIPTEKKYKGKPLERRMIKRPLSTISSKTEKKAKTDEPECRDPRFDELSGNLNIEVWRKQFSFIAEKRKKERNLLVKAHKKCKDKDEKIEIQKHVNRMKNQEREHDKLEKLRIMKREEKSKAIETLKLGKNPHFTSDFQKKKIITENYVKSLKNKDKYYIRKEKKLASKEKKRNLVPRT